MSTVPNTELPRWRPMDCCGTLSVAHFLYLQFRVCSRSYPFSVKMDVADHNLRSVQKPWLPLGLELARFYSSRVRVSTVDLLHIRQQGPWVECIYEVILLVEL